MRLDKFGLWWLLVLFFAVWLVSCTSPTVLPSGIPPTLQIAFTEPAVESTPTAILFTPMPEVTEVPSSPIQRLFYSIDAVYDASQNKVEVSQRIHFANPSTQPLNEIVLVAEPNRFANGFVLNRLEDQMTAQPLDWELQGNQLQVALKEPLTFQESIAILAEYVLQLPQIPPPSDTNKPQIYGYTQRQTNLVDWYLWLPPYDDGTGWIIHPPSFFGEYTVYPLADFEVRFEVINSPQEVLVAASTSPSQHSQNRWKYVFNNARNFAISISPDFLVEEALVDGVKISHYYFPLYRRQGEVVLQHTIRAYQLYSQLFGELPRQSISVVQADFLDGMEFDGLFFLSKGFYDLYDGTDQGYLTLITVHETAHQWWYGAVANDQARNPWLDEALCTYAERLYYEQFIPEMVDWWWFYRINFYQPQGVIDLPVYDYAGYLAYRDAVYLRGALFLEELRKNLGDERFFYGLKRYYTENNGKIATPVDFFNAFELSKAEIEEFTKAFFATRP